MKFLYMVIIIVILLSNTGCASIVHTTPIGDSLCNSISGTGVCFKEKNLIYIGTRKDAETIADTDSAAILFPILDIPFSFVLDTLFLPFTVPYTLVAD